MLGSSVAQSIVIKVQLGTVAFIYGTYFSICSLFYAFNSIGTIGYEVSGFVIPEEVGRQNFIGSDTIKSKKGLFQLKRGSIGIKSRGNVYLIIRAGSGNPELKQYYERKQSEGKSKMLVLNNIRNKLIHRICACVQDNRLFQTKNVASQLV